MIKKILTLVAALAVSSSAFALSTVSFSKFAGTGTVFGAVLATTNDIGVHATFCLERDEALKLDGTVYHYALSEAAMAGGTSTAESPIVGGKDFLSKASAWLMRNYALKTLTGFDGTVAKIDALQNAFWILEGELKWTNSNPFVNLAIAALGGKAAALENSYGLYGVKVMNVWTVDSKGAKIRAQDQIIFVPDTASTLALLGLGMAVIGFAARRRS